jgi:hypothetical protein
MLPCPWRRSVPKEARTVRSGTIPGTAGPSGDTSLSREHNWTMGESNQWPYSRYATLLVVLMFHAAVLAALLIGSGTLGLPASRVDTVQLLYLAPVTFPKVRSDDPLPRRTTGRTAVSITPPVPASPTTSETSAPAASSVGSGSGVDWTLEARRALNAFEIHQHQPAVNKSVSTQPEEDNWWPRGPHHAGERFKTADGDWIVWIDANCYQVASPGPSIYAPGATLPRTVCRSDSTATARSSTDP